MLVYLSTAYTQALDKDALMKDVMTFSGQYMALNPGHHVVSPLFNHNSLDLVPELGKEYDFWQNYSRELLSTCGMLVVYLHPLVDISKSTGVQDEIETALKLGIPVLFISKPIKLA